MKYEVLTNEDEIKKLIVYHNHNSEYVVLDTETTSKDPREAKLLDIQMTGYDSDSVVIFGAEHAKLLLWISVTQVWQNFKYDFLVLLRHGVNLRTGHLKLRDPMLMSHLLNENRPSHSLDSWVQELTGDDYKERFWSTYDSYEAAPLDVRLEYGAKDIVYTAKVYEHLKTALSLDGISNTLVCHVHSLALALYDTEVRGVGINLDYVIDTGVRLKGYIEDLRPRMTFLCEDEIAIVVADMWRIERDKRKTEKGKAGVPMPEFSFESPKQLISLLYDVLALPEQRNEKTRNVSVDYDSLEKIRHLHPVVDLIQEYREHVKVYGTYIEGTLERQVGGRIYPSFNINGTKTGRISHSNPNLGNLPKSGGIRAMFVPDDGHQLVSADYGMLEVVIEAHYTQDKNLLKIVREGASKHDITAKALGISRDMAKTVNFASAYWCGPNKIAQILGVSNAEGKKAFDLLWETYSGPKKLKELTDKMVNQGIDIETLFGRKRRFEVKRRQMWDKDYRRAYNARIQGTGADCTNVSFYRAHHELQALGIGHGVLTVHDELVMSIKKEHVEQGREIIRRVMVDIGPEIRLSVPLTVAVSEGMNRWED